MRLLIPSRGIRRIPHLGSFLPEAEKIVSFGAVDAVAGWGRKPTSFSARKIAASRGIPYISLEDGFLRSFGLGVDGVAPLSLVADRSGIYYDSTAPSDLEKMIEAGNFDPALLARAQSALDWLRAERLSKYNKGFISHDGLPVRRLIVDQTAGDASVIFSGAGQDGFEKMVMEALQAHDASSVAVKLHPDTLKGKRGGYLRDLASRHGIRLIDQPVNPWDLLDYTDEVATLSSQFGFEALLAGKKVHCYGLPFYAGWGLTEDKLSCSRRARRASVVEIFAAAYIQYARYVDPFSGKAAALEDTIGLLSDLVRREKKTCSFSTAAGFSPWKKWFLPSFMDRRDLRFVPARKANDDSVVWASKRRDDKPILRMEDGFVRSNGLGVWLSRPWSLVLDRSGIYYDPRKASDLEDILQNAEMPEALLQRAAHVRRLLVERQLSKYNTGAALPDFDAGGRKVILVPGQVEDDASILTGAGEVRTNLDLLKSVRAENPDAYIMYKSHPDVEARRRKGAIEKAVALRYCDKVIIGASIAALWPVVNELHTMTSLAGFEALLRDKKVQTYGYPFYGGWGLTRDAHTFSRRTRKLTLDQLVAGALILYPLYFDWKTKKPCNIETVIRRLSSNKGRC